jgi:tRNA (cmo5U34)-methyltransferase
MSQYHFDPDSYLQLVTSEVPAYLELQAAAADATAGVAAARILELGVGTGETTARVMAQHPTARLIGIDESDGMLNVARQRFPDADLRVQRIEDPLPEGDYDLIVSALAVHHLDGPGKGALFHRIAERLRSGGRFVMADVITPEDPHDVVTPIDGVFDKPSRIDEQLRWITAAGLRASLAWRRQDLAVLVGDQTR